MYRSHAIARKAINFAEGVYDVRANPSILVRPSILCIHEITNHWFCTEIRHVLGKPIVLSENGGCRQQNRWFCLSITDALTKANDSFANQLFGPQDRVLGPVVK
jgi:hypothetical protein